MEKCPVYSFCNLKGMHSICTYTNPKSSLFCLLVCYGIGGEYFKH